MRRFSLLKVFIWAVTIHVFSALLGTIVAIINHEDVTLLDVLRYRSIALFVYHFLLSVVIYFAALNYIYKGLVQKSTGNLVEALSIIFLLFVGYNSLSTMIDSLQLPPFGLMAFSILLSSIFSCGVVAGVAYFFYMRDNRKAAYLKG